MRRRDFIKVIAASTAAWPLAANAQQPNRMPSIGFLWAPGPDDPGPRRRVSALSDALRDLGWVEGKNVAFAYQCGKPIWIAHGVFPAKPYLAV